MLQNPCKTLGFKKNMVYKIPPGGEVNHIQPVAYSPLFLDISFFGISFWFLLCFYLCLSLCLLASNSRLILFSFAIF